MSIQANSTYYISRTPILLEKFDKDARFWDKVLIDLHGSDIASTLVMDARWAFETLIPELPYIGGDENHLTRSLIWSAQCLALYQALKAHGKTAAEAGKILYDAILMKRFEPRRPMPSSKWLTPEQLKAKRQKRADRSQQRQHSADWVYYFVEGDAVAFDYGYDFTECGTQKFYRAHGGEEFLPYYCFLDYAVSEVEGLGLSRTLTLVDGDNLCNHRFKQDRETERHWPPPFLKFE
ncbi:MAG: L-2-amino-thiazoline-4-carboxylic acid hydrolase [Candidatus Promineifilaceae bacterium]